MAYMPAHFPDDFQAVLLVDVNVEQGAVIQANHHAGQVHDHAAHANPYLHLTKQLPVSLAPQLHRTVPASRGNRVDILQLNDGAARHRVLVRLAAEHVPCRTRAEALIALQAAVGVPHVENTVDVCNAGYTAAAGGGHVHVQVPVGECQFGVCDTHTFQVLFLGCLQLRRELRDERLQVKHTHCVFFHMGNDDESSGEVEVSDWYSVQMKWLHVAAWCEHYSAAAAYRSNHAPVATHVSERGVIECRRWQAELRVCRECRQGVGDAQEAGNGHEQGRATAAQAADVTADADFFEAGTR